MKAVFLGVLIAVQLPAQFGRQIKSDVDALASEPTVAVWQAAHMEGKLELAHYDTAKDPYEVDFGRMSRWCAASVSGLAGQVTRAVLFYVPAPDSQAQPQTRACRMESIWYETHAATSADEVVRELTALWGAPNGQSTASDVRGSGLWNDAAAWHRQGINIWAVFDHGGDANGDARPRLLVYARKDMPRDTDTALGLFSSAFRGQLIEAAAKIAGQAPVATGDMLSQAHCEATPLRQEAEPLNVRRLTQWLKSALGLAPPQQAASLLLADAYVACSRIPRDSLLQLGAEFKAGCPQDGPSYSHNLRAKAEKLDPKGLAGELAGLASLAEPCSLEGKRMWPDLVIDEGARLLSRYPRDEWTPWVHYAIARAHAARLSFAYPGGGPDGGDPMPLAAAAMRQERAAAVEHFESFIREKGNVPETAFAWQESWRLQAGLPPSPISFGCGCE